MNTKNIALLGLAILSMALLTISQRQASPEKESQLLLPTLKGDLKALEKVEIRTSTETVSIVRGDNGWVITEKNLYPADFSKLSDLLESMSQAKLVERKTSKPENFALLGVQGVDAVDSAASLVSAATPDHEVAVLVGHLASGRDGQFVRSPNENQVWLVDRTFVLGESALSWLERVIINIDAEKVVRVEQFDSSGVTRVLVERVEGEEDLVLRNLPEGRRLQYTTAANELARALVNVRLIDVQPHTAEKWLTSSRSEYSLDDDGKVTVTAIELNDRKWIHITSSGLEESPGYYDKWDFEVATHVYNSFNKHLDDLLEPVEEPSAVLK